MLKYFSIKLQLSVLAAAVIGFAGCRSGGELGGGAGSVVPQDIKGSVFRSEWNLFEDRIWVGNEMWAADFAAWKIEGGHLVCESDVAALQRVSLISRRVTGAGRRIVFKLRVEHSADDVKYGAVGFMLGLPEPDLTGARSKKSDAAGIFAGITASGKLVIQPSPTLRRLQDVLGSGDESVISNSVDLVLTAMPAGDSYTLLLQSFDGVTRLELARMSYWHVPAALVLGYPGLAAVSRAGAGGVSAAFSDWVVEGAADSKGGDAESEIGPIVGVWHTLSEGRLRMTVQLMPVGQRLDVVKLQVFDGREWKTKAMSEINPDNFRAEFRVDKLDLSRDQPYRVEYGESLSDGEIRYHYRSGTLAAAGALDSGRVTIMDVADAGCAGIPRADVYLFRNVPLPAENGKSLKDLQSWYRWCFANREPGRDISCLGIFDNSMTYRRVRIEPADTAAVSERDIDQDWTGWRGADVKVVCAPDMFHLAAVNDVLDSGDGVNEAAASADAGVGYVQADAAARRVVYNRVDCLGRRMKSYPGWPISCKYSAAYNRNHVGYLPAVEIMGRSNAVVQVINENSGKLVYSVRSSGTVLLPHVFEVGHYRLNAGEPELGLKRSFTGLTPGASEKTDAIRVAL